MKTFHEYMQDFLQKKKAKTVVEIGSDDNLSLALRLAPYCKRVYTINFPEDHRRNARFQESLLKSFGTQNIERKSGNALRLSELVPHADVIVVQNTLIELEDGDTAQMWRYKRGMSPYTNKEQNQFMARFDQAEEQAYREFLRVANPGYVVRFDWPQLQKRVEVLWKKLKIDPSRIQHERLANYGEEKTWVAYIVDNAGKRS